MTVRAAATRALVLAAAGLIVALPARAQCPDGTPPPCGPRSPAPASVAVLPFANLTRDSADAYLAEGLAEELISRLGAIERLRVPGRSAVQSAHARAAGDPAALAQRLGVRYLVEGSVRRGGQRLRISVRLLRAADGVRLWGGDFDRSQADLLDIQETVAREVATGVAGRLLPAERASVATRPTANPEAYDHFLRGNHLLARRSRTAIEQALAEYETAIRLDSGMARAWAQMAYAYALMYFYRWRRGNLPPESVLARGVAAGDRALRLDSSSSDAWLQRGFLLSYRHPDEPDRAVVAYRRAVALGPRNAEAWHGLGYILLQVGDTSGSREARLRALELDPLRATTLTRLAYHEWGQRQPAKSLRWADSAITADPLFSDGYAFRALAHLRLGNVAAALGDAETSVRLGADESTLISMAARVLAHLAAGDTTAARAHTTALLAEIADSAAPSPWEGLWAGIALTGLGDLEGALNFLERVRPRGSLLWALLQGPDLDRLRNHPRFQRLLEETRPRR